MALSRTDIGTFFSAANHGGGSWTTGSFTPPANSVLLFAVGAMHNTGFSDPSPDLSITDSAGLTWTAEESVGRDTTWSGGLKVWSAPIGGSPASMTVTIDADVRDIYAYVAAAVAYTGTNATLIGARAESAAFGTSGAQSLTLSAAPATSSEVLGILVRFFSGAGASTVGVGSGFSEVFDAQNAAQGAGIQVQARSGSTSTSVPWADVKEGSGSIDYILAMALEIQEGAGAPAAPTGVSRDTITSSSVRVTWTDASSDETGFKVQTAPSPFSSWTNAPASPAAANATSLTVTGLSPSTTYKARVASTNANGDSAWVETTEFTTSGGAAGRALLLGVG